MKLSSASELDDAGGESLEIGISRRGGADSTTSHRIIGTNGDRGRDGLHRLWGKRAETES